MAGQPGTGRREELPEELTGDRREREEHAGHRLRPGQPEPGRIGQNGRREAHADAEGRRTVSNVPGHPPPARHDDRHQSQRGEERAHHQHLGRDPELHDDQSEEHQPVVQCGSLLANEDLVEMGEEQGRNDQHARPTHVRT